MPQIYLGKCTAEPLKEEWERESYSCKETRFECVCRFAIKVTVALTEILYIKKYFTKVLDCRIYKHHWRKRSINLKGLNAIFNYLCEFYQILIIISIYFWLILCRIFLYSRFSFLMYTVVVEKVKRATWIRHPAKYMYNVHTYACFVTGCMILWICMVVEE